MRVHNISYAFYAFLYFYIFHKSIKIPGLIVKFYANPASVPRNIVSDGRATCRLYVKFYKPKQNKSVFIVYREIKATCQSRRKPRWCNLEGAP